MKFISPETHPNQMVWDKRKNISVCEFKDCELETEDEYVIKNLVELGYSYEGELPVNGENKSDSEITTGGIIEKNDNVIISENGGEVIIPLTKNEKTKDVK